MNTSKNVNRLVKISLLVAIAFILMLFEFPIPGFPPFLKLDLSDLPALIGGFALGPVAGVIIEGGKVILNLVFHGTYTGGVGEFANFLIGGSFVFVASYVYHKNKTKKSAIIGLILGTIIMTIVVLIFGEITPKTLASQNSEQISLRVANPIFIVSKMLKPVVIITTTISKLFIKLLGGKSDSNKPFITEDELKTMVDVSEEEGILMSEEKDMIHNVFQFGDLYAKDVMVQRVDIIALDIEESLDKIISVIKEEGFSRIPIYSDTIDNIVGILNVKDIIFMEDTKEFSLNNYMREITYTYEFRKVTELFKDMNKNRQHMVVVLDEYGGTVGIVTIEDLIEEIVGDISDEYDDEEPEIYVVKEDEYIVEGSVRIEDINELIGTKIESEEFDSIGGFIIGVLGRFPNISEEIIYSNYRFIIEDIDRNRIKKIRIYT
ncbi:MAG TPA: hemolysin [Clostridium sp.]|nr:hemolysin [Clostridium sp.]